MSDTHVAKTDAKSADTERSERAEPGVMLPPVDVVEDALGITLYADLPGVPKDKLHVRIDADALTIEGEVSLPMAGNLEPSHVEVQLPRYQRTFTLGKELDSEKVSAEFRHGVLKLSIPKVEHAKPRKIEISVD
ncbi:MAG: Hsp20/alpha crystallin family protein [Propionivibrio sp.]|jgi:HSP20 family protein|nr:Hsp20/alpha crystallin family protein [Propionivibrio sp.]MBP6712105.1 Hsp20/alpha crystallin family protein [Propionivibrio sp.]MBP7523628.1 Hsp20/alpha crystallin family protein [Propionivibrio sp.]MBP8162453.1 Hsp20/alpha crystallin family protein [Propionivibrio sp.]